MGASAVVYGGKVSSQLSDFVRICVGALVQQLFQDAPLWPAFRETYCIQALLYKVDTVRTVLKLSWFLANLYYRRHLLEFPITSPRLKQR